MNSVIKYPGSKWSIANWIISHFPSHHSYLEPFFGSGAVLFTKKRSPIETVNDLDKDVVNLFRQIREDTERLADAIYWTSYARSEYERAWAAQYTETDPFQRAVDFYIRMMMGHGFRTNELEMFPYLEGAGTEEQIADWIEQVGLSEDDTASRARDLCWKVIEGFINVVKTQPTLTPPNEPLTLEQLREMDGEPVWIVEHPDWGHWELSADAEDYIADRDQDLYGLKHDDPAGQCGLHVLGWLAYRRPPEGEVDGK